MQDNATGYLVQAGYGITNNSYSPVYSVFYEFVGPGATIVHLAQGGTNDSTHLGFTYSAGDLMLFSLWYNSTYDGWGLAIQDVTTNHIWQHYVYTNNANDYLYIGHTAIVASEIQDCAYLAPLFNDGTLTIKQPQWHLQNGSEYYFSDGPGTMYHSDMYNAGTLCETAGATDANQYAYHTWIYWCN